MRAFLFSLALILAALPQQAEAFASGLYSNDHYDVAADPEADLARALSRAQAENKRVLLIVGGDWCVWCEILQRYIEANDDVEAAFEASFVAVKVNWSRENRNEAFLSRFPETVGYPDFFVIDRDGALLTHKETGDLEEGPSYNRARMLEFAQRWRP